MKYHLYNNHSGKKHKTFSENWVDVQTLGSDFYHCLRAEDEVFLSGGDGTVNCFINKCQVFPKLTIIPSGTGNDLVRSLQEQYQRVPIFKCNDKYFINGFGVGFDALVCQMVSQAKHNGKTTFPIAVYKALFKSKVQDIQVEIDGINYSFPSAFFVAIQNGKYFGGGVQITPKQDLTSEQLSICVVSNGSKLVLATLFPTALFGLHHRFTKYVRILTGTSFKVKLENKYISQRDGEVDAETDVFQIDFVDYIEVRKDGN